MFTLTTGTKYHLTRVREVHPRLSLEFWMFGVGCRVSGVSGVLGVPGMSGVGCPGWVPVGYKFEVSLGVVHETALV